MRIRPTTLRRRLRQPSLRHTSGLALRSPRIVRIRTDKTVADIDTLTTARQLMAQMAELRSTKPRSSRFTEK